MNTMKWFAICGCLLLSLTGCTTTPSVEGDVFTKFYNFKQQGRFIAGETFEGGRLFIRDDYEYKREDAEVAVLLDMNSDVVQHSFTRAEWDAWKGRMDAEIRDRQVKAEQNRIAEDERKKREYREKLARQKEREAKEKRDRELAWKKQQEERKLAEEAKLKKIKEAKYSTKKAKLRLNTDINCYSYEGIYSCNDTIIITSIDDEPFILERIIFNNKEGSSDCDKDNMVELMTTGDNESFTPFGCGDIVKVEVFTNRGNSTYRL